MACPFFQVDFLKPLLLLLENAKMTVITGFFLHLRAHTHTFVHVQWFYNLKIPMHCGHRLDILKKVIYPLLLQALSHLLSHCHRMRTNTLMTSQIINHDRFLVCKIRMKKNLNRICLHIFENCSQHGEMDSRRRSLADGLKVDKILSLTVHMTCKWQCGPPID